MSSHPWLQPIVFADGRTLPTRILPGPMEGVTEGSFLSAMSKRDFVNAWFTPFLRISTGVPRRSRLQHWLQPFLHTGMPVIAQIMGIDSAKLATTAAILHSLGATCVDLNCACPSPTVIGNGGGGKRLCEPDWIARTLDAMREACGNHAISVKIRVGFDSPAELPAIAEAVRAARPDLVFCHFRTVRELYRPISDGLQRLAKARDLLPDCILFGSGDLFTADDAEAMRQQCAVDGVIPARGLLQNPALLRDIHDHCHNRPPTPLSDAERIDFIRDIAAASGQRPGANHGFVLRVAAGLYGRDSALFRELATCRNLRMANECLNRADAATAPPHRKGPAMSNAKDKSPVTPATRLLNSLKVPYQELFYDFVEKGGTSHLAKELNLDEHAVVKTLIFETDAKKPLVVLMHGDRSVSTKNLARILGVKTVAPCDPAQAERNSGYRVGGTSPFGTRKAMPIYVEKTILDLPRIYINGGHRGFILDMAPADLVTVLKPTPVEVAICE